MNGSVSVSVDLRNAIAMLVVSEILDLQLLAQLLVAIWSEKHTLDLFTAHVLNDIATVPHPIFPNYTLDAFRSLRILFPGHISF